MSGTITQGGTTAYPFAGSSFFRSFALSPEATQSLNSILTQEQAAEATINGYIGQANTILAQCVAQQSTLSATATAAQTSVTNAIGTLTAVQATITQNVTAAATSATNAANSATNAETSHQAAITQAAAASTAATSASTSAAQASTSATNASSSAAAASTSATQAAASATQTANKLSLSGGVMTGAAEFGGLGTTTLGTGGGQADIHTYHTAMGKNLVPVVYELYPSGDRSQVSNGAISLSQLVSLVSVNDPAGNPGQKYSANLHSFQADVATTNATLPGNAGSNGFTNIGMNFTVHRPSQYATDAAAMAAYNAQSVKQPLSPITLQNLYTTTDTADYTYLPASVIGPLAVSENDMQINREDDNGTRGGYAIIVDQKQRNAAGGYHATMTHGFYINGIAAAFAGIGYRSGANVVHTVNSVDAVVAFQAVITAPQTAASPFAPNGTPAPAAAPAAPSGGSVIHIDSPSPTRLSGGNVIGGYQGGGIGGFIVGGDPGLGTITPSNPAYIQIGSNIYQAVGYQFDGPGYESGYLLISTVVATGDAAVGTAVSRPHYAVMMADQQRIGLEHTGQTYLAYDPTINNNLGGVRISKSVAVSGQVTMGSTGTDTTLFPLNLSTYGGVNRYIQWNPYANGIQIGSGPTINFTVDAGGTATAGAAYNISNAGGLYRVNNTPVVGARRTGWTAGTGTTNTPNRGTFSYDTATLAQLAARVNAIETDLTAHGLIGT